ncbi:MAG: hypothetical protein ACLRXA_22975 [Clostridium sp.]
MPKTGKPAGFVYRHRERVSPLDNVCQIMTEEQAKKHYENPFDITK